MIDIKLIRENPEQVKKNLRRRNNPRHIENLEAVIEIDKKWRQAQYQFQKLKAKKNELSKDINELKKQGKSIDEKKKGLKKLSEKVRTAEESVAAMKVELESKLATVPNLLDENVPDGKRETDNPEVKRWGEIREFDFEILNHVELLENLGKGDFEQGRKVSGKGFNYLLGEMAQLDLALQRYGVDFLLKKGFTVIVPPMLLNRGALGCAVNLNEFEEVIYKIEKEDLYLIGTAEHSIVSYFKDRIIRKEDLPMMLCAVTPSFRKEIGGHGVDTKGLFRMHQFNKVEQVVICRPEDSKKLHKEIQRISEEFFESLNIPYRVMEMCSAEVGDKAVKQWDIEAWFPRQGVYREVTSASNVTDYQSRRLGVKYYDGKEKIVPHLLNNTMVATSRAMVAILENFQQKNGTVRIPKVLEGHMNGRKFIGK